jgi:hypothetical protein
MAALRKIHSQDHIARFQDREIRRHIGLRARMRLNIDVIGAEDLLGPLNGQLFHVIDKLAASIVTAARIAFGVFVRHQAALRGQDRRTGEVLRGDQQQLLALALLFRANRSVHGRVGGFESFEGADGIAHVVLPFSTNSPVSRYSVVTRLLLCLPS